MKIKVILVDDHEIVRGGIKEVISKGCKDIKVTGEYSGGAEFLKAVRRKRADIYVLDIAMPGLNGFELAANLLKIAPESRIIFLSMHNSTNIVKKAFKCSAKGYVLKESAAEEIISAIRQVHKGRIFLSSGLSKSMDLNIKDGSEKKKDTNHLTERERDVLHLIAEGFSDKQITGKLHISLNTVHTHRKHIMKKLGIHKQTGLIRYAIRKGITKP